MMKKMAEVILQIFTLCIKWLTIICLFAELSSNSRSIYQFLQFTISPKTTKTIEHYCKIIEMLVEYTVQLFVYSIFSSIKLTKA